MSKAVIIKLQSVKRAFNAWTGKPDLEEKRKREPDLLKENKNKKARLRKRTRKPRNRKRTRDLQEN